MTTPSPTASGRRTRSRGASGTCRSRRSTRCRPSTASTWSSSAAARRYVSAWLARRGARPIGVDLSENQLATAKRKQAKYGLEFPLIHASAEDVPLPDECADLVVSEYGACLWCDPDLWLAEAARLLRPEGRLVFLTNSLLGALCAPDVGTATDRLVRDQRGL